MDMKCGYDPCTNRWFIYLPKDPGKPRIEADDRETLLAFLEEHVRSEMVSRSKLKLVKQGAA